jgi:hypothetical protein
MTTILLACAGAFLLAMFAAFEVATKRGWIPQLSLGGGHDELARLRRENKAANEALQRTRRALRALQDELKPYGDDQVVSARARDLRAICRAAEID